MGTSVLIVEDDEQLRSAVARDLSRRGFDVTTASSVEGALERLQGRSFDVLLTDLRMDGADGIDLLGALGRVAPGTRPILMSAFASARDHQRAMQLGAVQVLCKPFTPGELLRAIQQAVECERGFRGSVHGLSLIDVLQMFHYGRRSLSVFVGGTLRGEIHVKDGEIVDARHGDLAGEDALRRILALPSGSIETGPFDSPDRSVQRPFQSLLLDVLRELDEEKATEDPFGGFDGAFCPYEPPTIPRPGVTLDASRVCADVVSSIEGAFVCAAVDLEARSLVGFHDTLGLLEQSPEVLVDDTVDLFRSSNLVRIDGEIGAQRPQAGEEPPLEEVRVLSPDSCRLGVSLPGGRRAVVLFTFRETDPGLAFWHLKATLPKFERVL